MTAREANRPSRRAFLGAAGAAVAAGLTAGCEPRTATHAAPSGTPAPAAVPATGPHQAGITLPQPAQPNLLAVIGDLTDGTNPRALLAELGTTIQALTTGTDQRLAGLPPGDLTITVGAGPRLVHAVDPNLPGATGLPRFAREQMLPTARGGDLLLQVCATDPLVLPLAAAALLDQAGPRVVERWRQSGRRGPHVPVAPGITAPRNVLGFIDGIVGPHTPTEQGHDLWLAGPPAVAGGTIAVLRRMELDLARFATLPATDQNAIFGRHRDTGAPLSGGTIDTDPDLGAKTPDGRYLIPVGAHIRRAHSAAVGVGLMLRRSYSTDNPAPGLLFISYQNDVRTFTATLTRMDNGDTLLPFTLTTASATFLILAGHDETHPLGSTLFG